MKTDKNIIVEIAEGLGNQLFMYSHAYSISKKMKYKLFIDNTSGYFKKKNNLRSHQKFLLDKLMINMSLAPSNLRYDSKLKLIKKKIELIIQNLKKKKKFIIEKYLKTNGKKKVLLRDDLIDKFLDKNIYIQGNFENEDYFKYYRNDLIKIFKPNHKYLNNNNKYINLLRSTNSVSIHIRKNKYTEQVHEKKNLSKIALTNKFTKDLYVYIKKAVEYFEKKIHRPKFFIWSNDFKEIDKYFDNKKFIFIKNNDAINDFYLFSFAKHFIVGASTFHWWGAWLNENPNKICVCPYKINPSNNENFYPKDWIKIR